MYISQILIPCCVYLQSFASYKSSVSKQREISSDPVRSGLTSNTEIETLEQTVTVLLELSTRMGHLTLSEHTLPLTVSSDIQMNEDLYYTVMNLSSLLWMLFKYKNILSMKPV